MFLKLFKFTFVAVSVIVGCILIYNLSDNGFTNISKYIFTTIYADTGFVNNQSILNATVLQHLEAYVMVPVNGYDITDPAVFYHIIQNRAYEITFSQLHQGLAYAIRVDNALYTIDPNLIKVFMYII